MNKLPESWCVENDGSQLFKDTVIKYLNELYPNSPSYIGDTLGTFYGITTPNKRLTSSRAEIYQHVLTLNQFIEMTTEWAPEEGELVEVSIDNKSWVKRIFLYKDKNDIIHTVVDTHELAYKNHKKGYLTISWFFMRKIEEPKTIEVTIEEIAKLKGVKPEQIRIKD